MLPMTTEIICRPGRLSEYARERALWHAHREGWSENRLRASLGLPQLDGHDRIIPRMAGGASATDYVELKVLDMLFNDPGTTFISADPYLGLWTTALDDTKTGSATGEANYTGYGRKQIPNTSMSAASSGSKTNTVAITFDPCTALSSTVTYWGTCDASTAGNLLVWGTCTSTLIDTSHTPATIPIGGIVVTAD